MSQGDARDDNLGLRDWVQGVEMSKAPQFRLRTLFMLIVVASVVSLVWRWDRQAQEARLQDEARYEALQTAAAVAEFARIVDKPSPAAELVKLRLPKVIVEEISLPDVPSRRPYDQSLMSQSLINDLPKR